MNDMGFYCCISYLLVIAGLKNQILKMKSLCQEVWQGLFVFSSL